MVFPILLCRRNGLFIIIYQIYNFSIAKIKTISNGNNQ